MSLFIRYGHTILFGSNNELALTDLKKKHSALLTSGWGCLSFPLEAWLLDTNTQMSVPPWKQALMERKKQKDTEEQHKQVKEGEQLANLPAWKRAIILKQREKEKKDGVTTPAKPEQQSTPGRSNSFETRNAVVATTTKSVPKAEAVSIEHQTAHVLSERPAIPKSESADRLAKVDSVPQRRTGSLPKSQSFDVLAKPDLSERRTSTGVNPEPIPKKQTAEVAKSDSSSEHQPGIGLPKSQSSVEKTNSAERQTASAPSIGKFSSVFSRTEMSQKPPSATTAPRTEPPGKVTKTASLTREQTTPTPAPEVPKDTAKQPQPAVPSNAGEAVSSSNAPPPVTENKVPQLSAQQPTEQLSITEARLDQPQALPPLPQNSTPAALLQATNEAPRLYDQDEASSRVSSNRNSLEIPPSVAPPPAATTQPSKAQQRRAEEISTKAPVPIPAWKKALLERKKSTSTQPVVSQDQAAASEPQLATVVLKPVQKQVGKSPVVASASTGTALVSTSDAAPLVTSTMTAPLGTSTTTAPLVTSTMTAPLVASTTTLPASTPKGLPDLKLKAAPKNVTPRVFPSVTPRVDAPNGTPADATGVTAQTSERKTSFPTSIKPKPGAYQKSPAPTPPATPRNSISSPPPTPTLATPLSPSPPPTSPTPVTETSPPPDPEIITSETKEPLKLLQREGVELRPPVFQEVKEWANVPESDPQFQGLPQWKKALILRRREDIAKRSGHSTSTVAKPTTAEQQSEAATSNQPNRTSAVATSGQPASNDRSIFALSSVGNLNKWAGDQAGNDKTKLPWTGGEGKINAGTPPGQTAGSDKTKPPRPPSVNDRTKPGPNLNQSAETNSNKLTGASLNQSTPNQKVRASSHQSYDVTSTQSSGINTLLERFGPKGAPNTTLTPTGGKSKSPTGSAVLFPTPQTEATTPEPSKAGGLKPPLFSPPPDQLSPMRPSPTSELTSPVGPLSPEDQESDDDLEVTNIDDVLGEEVDEEVDGRGGCSAPIVIQSIQSDAFLPQVNAPPASVKTNGLDMKMIGLSSKLPVSLSVGKGNEIPPPTSTPLSPPISPLQKTPPISPTSPTPPISGSVKSILSATGEALTKKTKVRART